WLHHNCRPLLASSPNSYKSGTPAEALQLRWPAAAPPSENRWPPGTGSSHKASARWKSSCAIIAPVGENGGEPAAGHAHVNPAPYGSYLQTDTRRRTEKGFSQN